MKRLFRWLFNLVAAASLLICVGTILIWVRSYAAYEEVGYAWTSSIPGGGNRNQRAGIVTQRGSMAGFYVFDESRTFARRSGFYVMESERLTRPVASILSRLGFFAQRSTLQYASGLQFGSWFVQLPCWPVVGAAALLPTWIFWTRRRRNLCPAGNICVSCGYDLRATPDRCPECGTVRVSGQSLAQ